jgi:HD-GYP domain-containing protein (c-di-GMP phosphodiesterase class II)
MELPSPTVARERTFAVILGFLGVCSLVYAMRITAPGEIQSRDLLLAAIFSGAIVLADRFPIHLIRGTKASFVNLPIYLSAVLLPAPLAVGGAGMGLLIADFIARTERGLLPRDMLSSVGQWMFTAFLGFKIVHSNLFGISGATSKYGLLLLCAIAFLLVDALVFSLSQSLLFGEAFIATLKAVLREGMVLEIIQYLTAILGTLAALEDTWALVLVVVPLSITYIAFKNLKETRHETVQILEDMADTVDLRDIYTGGHSKRVAELVRAILMQLKISGPEATLIELAARLHDIGKIGIPDSILVKPSTLGPEEMAQMQTHSQKGADLISKYKDFTRGAMIIRHHHERWDGFGYPAGLKGPEIPFGARIIAVADSFDAMTSDRPYRTALSRERAIQILLEGRGTQWDTNVVNTFVDMVDKIEAPANEMHKSSCSDQVLARELLHAAPASSR